MFFYGSANLYASVCVFFLPTTFPFVLAKHWTWPTLYHTNDKIYWRSITAAYVLLSRTFPRYI
jgi:hypothetical protein